MTIEFQCKDRVYVMVLMVMTPFLEQWLEDIIVDTGEDKDRIYVLPRF